jgi:hypothetical protein
VAGVGGDPVPAEKPPECSLSKNSGVLSVPKYEGFTFSRINLPGLGACRGRKRGLVGGTTGVRVLDL